MGKNIILSQEKFRCKICKKTFKYIPNCISHLRVSHSCPYGDRRDNVEFNENGFAIVESKLKKKKTKNGY